MKTATPISARTLLIEEGKGWDFRQRNISDLAAQAESLMPPLPLLPPVNSVSEFGFSQSCRRMRLRRIGDTAKNTCMTPDPELRLRKLIWDRTQGC